VEITATPLRRHYTPHCPTPEGNADVGSAVRSHEDFLPLGAYYHGKGSRLGEARGRGHHCTYLGGFINITAGDCGKALDKIPEEHGMRSTKPTNKQAMIGLVVPL